MGSYTITVKLTRELGDDKAVLEAKGMPITAHTLAVQMASELQQAYLNNDIAGSFDVTHVIIEGVTMEVKSNG